MGNRRSLHQECKFSPCRWNLVRARRVAALKTTQARFSILNSKRAENPGLVVSNPSQNLAQQNEAFRSWKPDHLSRLPKIRHSCFTRYEFKAVEEDAALGSEINTESPQPDVQVAG